jgi:hypothetical protein
MTVVRTSYRLTGWNATQLKLRVPAILTAYGKAVGNEFQAQIKAVQYPWDRPTRRKNGATVGSPRDIVDLGGFLRSQRRERVNATTLRFSWNTPYASLIFSGYTTNRGTVCRPRNWIEPALNAQPLDRFFADQWRALARRSL